MKIEGTVAAVTGANRGLGAHLLQELLRRDATKVYAVVRSAGSVDPDVAAHPAVVVVEADVDDSESLAAAAAKAGDVSLLVNNAGVLAFNDVLDGDVDQFRRDMETNYFGLLNAARAFTPALQANGPSTMVNVVTLIALAPVQGMAGYSASKAAAHSLTQSLRGRLRGTGVDVLAAYPAGIDTDMLAGVDAAKADPAVVAARILDGVAAVQPVIWPDDTSAQAGSVYAADPSALEAMLSA